MVTFQSFKYKRIREAAEKYNINTLVASSSSNVFYLSGFKSHKLISTAQIYVLYDIKKSLKLIVLPLASIPTLIELDDTVEIYGYGEFYFSFFENAASENIKNKMKKSFKSADEALIEAIKSMGVKNCKIGFDESKVKPQTWNLLCKIFPGIEFYPSTSLFSEIRKIKHIEEIDLLERSSEIAEESLFEVIKKLNIGLSEQDMGVIFTKEVTKRGALPNFSVITIDERSAFADTINTEKKVQDGSIIRFDVGCIYQGYCSDMARTVTIGNVDSRYKKYYNYLLEGELAAIDYIRPGITPEDIFNTAMETVRKGIPHYQRQHCGHGLGIEGYNPPLIAPREFEEIQAGMVLCIETPYYELGWGGLQVEDTIVVEENGYRYLTKSNQNLIEK